MPSSLKILYITQEIPYPLASGYLRHYHFLRALARIHDITYFSLTLKPSITEETLNVISTFAKRFSIFGLPKDKESYLSRKIAQLPLVGKKAQRSLRIRRAAIEMKKAVQQLVKNENIDMVFFSGKTTFPSIAQLKGIPLVVDCCDATSSRIRGELKYAAVSKMPWLLMRYFEVKRIEKKLVKKSPFLLFASNRDRLILIKDQEKGEIIPQAVEIDYWNRGDWRSDQGTIVFTGVMNYSPNHDAALYLIEKILPIIQKSFPHIKCIIAGRDPLPALQASARHHPNVTVTGFVEDIRPYLAKATVYVAPIRYGAGVQNKILEAMAMEIPVVTTTVVADGLRINGLTDLPLRTAEDEEQFAQEILKLLNHDQERARLASEGRKFVQTNFVWERNIEKLEKICQTAAGRS